VKPHAFIWPTLAPKALARGKKRACIADTQKTWRSVNDNEPIFYRNWGVVVVPLEDETCQRWLQILFLLPWEGRRTCHQVIDLQVYRGQEPHDYFVLPVQVNATLIALSISPEIRRSGWVVLAGQTTEQGSCDRDKGSREKNTYHWYLNWLSFQNGVCLTGISPSGKASDVSSESWRAVICKKVTIQSAY